MKYYLGILCLAAVLVGTGCGGGDHNSIDARNVSGVWRGALTKISDACVKKSSAAQSITHQITQNVAAVTLLSQDGVDFLGNLVGDNGLSVDATHATIGQAGCQDQTRIEYNHIDGDGDNTADVDIDIMRTCAGALVCEVVYNGIATR